MPTVATVIDLKVPESWPADLLAYLIKHHSLFLDWESTPTHVAASAYDRAIYGLRDVLQQYAITGWHCTRLTEVEMAAITADGIQLPDAAMLSRRIDRLLGAGLVTEAIADNLKANNLAHEQSRAGKVWFCFFPPHVGRESGIGRFFHYWGGEALYVCHERDPQTAAVISSIGVPCLVEADVPIASLEPNGGLSFKIVRRFLINRGYQTGEPVDHEDRIKRPLPAENVRRIIPFPHADFVTLTGCADWKDPLRAVLSLKGV
jgi:hypothetical protein